MRHIVLSDIVIECVYDMWYGIPRNKRQIIEKKTNCNSNESKKKSHVEMRTTRTHSFYLSFAQHTHNILREYLMIEVFLV